MVAKPQIENGTRGRAGMSVARAQRLSSKADAQEKTSGAPMLLLTVAALALIGGGAFFFSTTQEPADTPRAATVVAVEDTAPVAEAAQNVSAPAVPPVAQAVAEPTETVEPVAAFVPRPVLAPCVQLVEERLHGLQRADAEALPWEVKRDRIRGTAQAVLDCDQASVSFAGDFELTATDFADLHVLWDREEAALVFTIVDSMPPDAFEVVLTDDGQPIEFIVH